MKWGLKPRAAVRLLARQPVASGRPQRRHGPAVLDGQPVVAAGPAEARPDGVVGLAPEEQRPSAGHHQGHRRAACRGTPSTAPMSPGKPSRWGSFGATTWCSTRRARRPAHGADTARAAPATRDRFGLGQVVALGIVGPRGVDDVEGRQVGPGSSRSTSMRSRTTAPVVRSTADGVVVSAGEHHAAVAAGWRAGDAAAPRGGGVDRRAVGAPGVGRRLWAVTRRASAAPCTCRALGPVAIGVLAPGTRAGPRARRRRCAGAGQA